MLVLSGRLAIMERRNDAALQRSRCSVVVLIVTYKFTRGFFGAAWMTQGTEPGL